MHDIIRLFVGYDERLALSYHVFVQSVMQYASQPISITPLKLSHFQQIFHRERSLDQLTDFTYTRFLIPYLCNYQGWAMFMDGTDMMLLDDIAKLWDLRNNEFDVMVAKHPEMPGNHSFLNKTIQSYKMFNWSSLMLFNNEKCTQLSRDYVHTASYHDLHQFKWVSSEEKIGELPLRWNYLCGYHEPSQDVSLVHWTQGAPHLEGKEGVAEFAEEWLKIKNILCW